MYKVFTLFVGFKFLITDRRIAPICVCVKLNTLYINISINAMKIAPYFDPKIFR